MVVSSEVTTDRLFHTLADATRRDIVRRTMRREHSVSALARLYPMSFAAVQKHVAVLERAGVVTKAQHGRECQVRGNVLAIRHASQQLEEYEVCVAAPHRPDRPDPRRNQSRGRRAVKATNLAELYDAAALDWGPIEARLRTGLSQAPGAGGPDRHTCWLATVNQDGSPHVTGIGATWVDGSLYFETGEATQRPQSRPRRAVHAQRRDPRLRSRRGRPCDQGDRTGDRRRDGPTMGRRRVAGTRR